MANVETVKYFGNEYNIITGDDVQPAFDVVSGESHFLGRIEKTQPESKIYDCWFKRDSESGVLITKYGNSITGGSHDMQNHYSILAVIEMPSTLRKNDLLRIVWDMAQKSEAMEPIILSQKTYEQEAAALINLNTKTQTAMGSSVSIAVDKKIEEIKNNVEKIKEKEKEKEEGVKDAEV
jgi:hypothetical protein